MTEFRREVTSHGVRNNRNPTQVPEAARRAGMTMQQYDRWLVDSNMLLTMFSQDISKGKIS